MPEEITRQEFDSLQRQVTALQLALESQPRHLSLPFQIDPQSDFVLEQKFRQHGACARSHKTSDQTVTNTTETKIVWETNTYAAEVTWDSTNNRFVVRRPGRYLITAAITWNSTAANGLYQILLYRNGSELARATALSNATAGLIITPLVIDTAELQADDYIEINAYHSSGADKTILGSSNQSYFSIIRID